MPIKPDKTDSNKKKMLEALGRSLGIVSTACAAVGISRQTHYEWMSEDEEYKKAVADIDEKVIDFAESKLHQLVDGVKIAVPDPKNPNKTIMVYKEPPNATAVLFMLKTKGRKRGYEQNTRSVEVETGGEKTVIRFSDAE